MKSIVTKYPEALILVLVVAAALLGWRLSSNDQQASAETQSNNNNIASIRSSAEHGNAEAQLYLGEKYFFGEGVEKDYSQAAKWYRLAGEQGSVDAQYLMGRMFLFGKGVPQNYEQAYIWMFCAAEQGQREAQYDLGVMLIKDIVPINLGLLWGVEPESYKWLSLAASQGQGNAAELRDSIAENMDTIRLRWAQDNATRWRAKEGLTYGDCQKLVYEGTPEVREGNRRLEAWKASKPRDPAQWNQGRDPDHREADAAAAAAGVDCQNARFQVIGLEENGFAGSDAHKRNLDLMREHCPADAFWRESAQ